MIVMWCSGQLVKSDVSGVLVCMCVCMGVVMYLCVSCVVSVVM